MKEYYRIFLNGFTNYGRYLWDEISHPGWNNYFYLLIALSLGVWLLELILPWRTDQKAFRRDFWLDAFYMFFNFFLFSLIGYNALSNVAAQGFNDLLGTMGISNPVALELSQLPMAVRWILLLVIADFIQWNVHRWLHKYPWLWQFHKLHHSVKEMGFAAHLRFHWMETVIYKTVQFVPLTMIGFGLNDLFTLHAFTILVGHLNHANLGWSYGPLKYVLNNPRMHIWHHAHDLPPNRYGVNFGLTLSLWDYLFGTAYIPSDGRDIVLGFPGDKRFPHNFFSQITYPWNRRAEKEK